VASDTVGAKPHLLLTAGSARDALDGDCRGFAAANAGRGDTAFQVTSGVCSSVTINLAPVASVGRPSAQAPPPLTLSFSIKRSLGE
jgi:hypothetical protein